MTKPWQGVVLIVLAALAVLLMAANAVLLDGNRRLQTEANARQQFVQQSANLEVLYRGMAKDLAELAVKSNDSELLHALAANGISISPAAAAAPAPVTAPTGAKR